MGTNADIVHRIEDALGRGDILEPMAFMARDVRWTVRCTNPDVAPWFGTFEGRRGVAAFLDAMSEIRRDALEVKRIVEDADTVVVWVRFAFTTQTGRHVDMDEVQIWTFEAGKVRSVDLFPDTLAVASALG